MEARASFSGPSVRKAFVAVVLVIIVIGVAAMARYVVSGLSAGVAAAVPGQTTVHAAPSTALRQDNPYVSRSNATDMASSDEGLIP